MTTFYVLFDKVLRKTPEKYNQS